MSRIERAKKEFAIIKKIYEDFVRLNGKVNSPQNRKSLLETINYARKHGFRYSKNVEVGVVELRSSDTERHPDVQIYTIGKEFFINMDILEGNMVGLNEFIGEYEMEMRGI